MGATTSNPNPIPQDAYINNPYMAHTPQHRTDFQNSPTFTNDTVLQNSQTSKNETVLQNSRTPKNDTVLQNSQTSTNETVLQNSRTSTNETVLQNSRTSTNETVLQNSRTSTNKTVLQNSRTSTNETVLQNSRTSKNKTVLQNSQTSTSRNMPSNVQRDVGYSTTTVSEAIYNQTPITSIAKKKNIMARPPDDIKDLNDFLKKWNIWKEQFKSYIHLIDEEHTNFKLWGSMFLNLMGPVSQEIRDLLLFHNEDESKNYNILMAKFHSFYQFNMFTKTAHKSPMTYINELKDFAVKNFKNQDEILKDKLVKDISNLHKERFIALASSKLKHFTFETKFKSLTLREIAFLWDTCEKSVTLNNGKCTSCGSFHKTGNCPASGLKCNNCNRKNHFIDCCPGPNYINDCLYCGGDHYSRQCLAYGEICSKCSRENHFSWKCGNTILISNCKFCGLNHINSRNACPAKKYLCAICKLYGHYDLKCPKNNKNNL